MWCVVLVCVRAMCCVCDVLCVRCVVCAVRAFVYVFKDVDAPAKKADLFSDVSAKYCVLVYVWYVRTSHRCIRKRKQI